MRSMLFNRAFTALVDMRFNIVLVDDFLRGFTPDLFERDLKTFHATTRTLEIVSKPVEDLRPI